MDLAACLSQTANLEEALDLNLRAVEINPNNAIPRYHLGRTLLFLNDERLRPWLQLAYENLADDDRHRCRLALMLVDLCEGNAEAARKHANRVVSRASDWTEGVLTSVDVLLQLGDLAIVIPRLESWRERSPSLRMGLSQSARDVTTALGLALWQMGEMSRANELFDESIRTMERSIETGRDSWGPRLVVASIHALRGETDAAIEWLNRAYECGLRTHKFLETDPMLEPLRDEERFVHLLDRMRIDVSQMKANLERDGTSAEVDKILEAAGRL